MINFFNERVDYPAIDLKLVKAWIKNCIEGHGFKTGDITIVFCSDEFLLDYNKRFLNHDYYTDIITFNYNFKNKISGDLFISVDTVKKNASEFSVPVNEEFLRVIIHGILHLIGFNDHSEEEISQMREQESLALLRYNSQ